MLAARDVLPTYGSIASCIWSGLCVLTHWVARQIAVTKACILAGSLSMVDCRVKCDVTGTLPPIYLFQIVSSVPSNSRVPQPWSLESFSNDNELTSTSTCLVFSEPSMVSTLPVPIHVTF